MTREDDAVMAHAVVREVLIEAPPEAVFGYFTDPAKMVQWKGRSATLDPSPGGVYRVEIDDRAIALGAYVEIDPPRRVVFTWGWENGAGPVRPGSSTVEVTLEAEGDGTRLRLVHRDLPEGERGVHAEGWDYFIPRLQAVAAGRDLGPGEHAG